MFIGMYYLPNEVDVVILAEIYFEQICPKLYLIVLFGIPGDGGGRESQGLFTVDTKTKLIPVNIKTAIIFFSDSNLHVQVHSFNELLLNRLWSGGGGGGGGG
jgi:hypothetical protein